jgi:hypothetical protein
MSRDVGVRHGGRSSLVLGLFDRESDARAVIDAVLGLGLSDQDYGLLAPGEVPSISETTAADGGSLLAQAAGAPGATGGTDVADLLESMGVPSGEARFYASESREGQVLVVVRADGRAEQVRELVLEHGGSDVQSQGATLIRGGTDSDGAAGSGVPGGVGPLPSDITANWPDFASRYEMLWQQHYGTTDATWEAMEPVYRYAWQLANAADYRGRPWSEVQAAVRRAWESSELNAALAWPDAEGPIRDVWEDVAEEAATYAEGGAARRIAGPGTDQAVAARDLESPREGAA